MGASHPPDPERRVFIGRIVKVRGLRGDLKILPLTWRPERFLEMDGVWAETPDGSVRYLSVKRIREENGVLFARFSEVARRDLAEPLVGSELFIDQDERSSLPDDHYYIDDIVGCSVVCSRFGELGSVQEVLEMPANDVWRVTGPKGEVLIPVLHDIVHKIDVAAGRISVTLPDGLLETETSGDSGRTK